MRKLLTKLFLTSTVLAAAVLPMTVHADSLNQNYNDIPDLDYGIVSSQALEAELNTTFITTAGLNLRSEPTTDSERINLIQSGRRVEVTNFRDGEWFEVEVGGQRGFMYAEFLREAPAPGEQGNVELLEWSVVRNNILTNNTPFTVTDVRSGLSWQMSSFSQGSHADIFTLTAEDTTIMQRAFGGRWTWTPRPVIVDINGRTLAASLSGMPHAGGGGQNGNNMNGHVCLHFLGSRTHNGNRTHERDHQNAVSEAFNTASNW